MPATIGTSTSIDQVAANYSERKRIGKSPIIGTGSAALGPRPPAQHGATMSQIDAEGQRMRAEWTFTASVLAEPMRGVDL